MYGGVRSANFQKTFCNFPSHPDYAAARAAYFAQWIEGILAGFALLFPVYLLGGTAAGDVKLLMLVGAWVGPEATLSVAIMTFLFGGRALALVLVRGRLSRLLAHRHATSEAPHGMLPNDAI
ncbi:A24 family peptidase [Paraburkholderia sp. JHI869]|uniref:A24 family peptidase n=1 Tax=Paraburkholderia sp. JHI869 TaxID=3112959 RepID=UPI00317BF500